MPREASIVESAKQRSLRVPLDYYRRPDALVRLKWSLAALVAGLSTLYIGWLFTDARRGPVHASPGPLSSVHAAWNDDCHMCHQSFQPLRSDAVNLTALVTGQAAHRESHDAACLKCHNVPVHHATAKANDVPGCAACHREHQGRAADIVRASDANCLSCHRDIEHHRSGASSLTVAVKNVIGFG